MNKSFFHDKSGKPSHSRLLVILCVPALVLVPLIVWAHMAWDSKTPLGIDATVPLYIGVANGIILGYAGYNKKQENASPVSPTQNPPVT